MNRKKQVISRCCAEFSDILMSIVCNFLTFLGAVINQLKDKSFKLILRDRHDHML